MPSPSSSAVAGEDHPSRWLVVAGLGRVVGGQFQTADRPPPTGSDTYPALYEAAGRYVFD